MRTVRMEYGISGGRADGTDWPPAGGLLECSDAEAAELVAAHLAVWADGEPEVETPEDTLDTGVEMRGKPIVNAPKAAWVEHAVGQGFDRGEAQAMNKADLINRLKEGPTVT